MKHSKRFDPELPTADRAIVTSWTTTGQPWGELSVDQADGFAPVEEAEPPSSVVNDDRGYGHGV